MIERFGTTGTECEGVFFTEGPPPLAGKRKGRITVRSDRQNKNLSDLKIDMARQAIRSKANVVANYRYGQKGKLLNWDGVRWYAEGEAYRVDDPH